MRASSSVKATGNPLSFSSVLLLGINGIIGSGIFLLPGSLFQQAGAMSLAAVALAGLATTLIALNYAVMASKIDEDGGAWIYANRAFGSLVGFQIGWFSWFLGVITISAEIAAFMTTLTGLVPALDRHSIYIGIAVSLLAVLAVINLFGPSTMKVIDNFSSTLKVLLLLVFVLGGAIALGLHTTAVQTIPKLQTSPHLIGAFTTAFYMFTGFSFLPTAAKEMTNAEKNLPRALVLVMLMVTGLYLLAQLMTMLLLGSHLIGNQLPVAAAFEQVVGAIGRPVILAGMLVSILGVAVAVSFDTPVDLASMASEKKLLPAVFGRQNRFQAPVVAILCTTGLAMLLVVSGSYLFLVKLIVFSAFIQYLATILATLKLRHAHGLPRGMKLPGGLLIPIVSLIVVAYLLTTFSLTTYVIGGTFALIGGLIYWLDRRSKR
ncbi:amino acid permease [Lactobacillus sp. CRM56-3]|uniref:Amino acid permease n=2 Tax=Secundilactobacillus folii TaxID=2678357 RepID=A0A7X3C3U0_9LACO|nr:APC family permease [Secundilactobacillus folii]MTV83202.1 amino acid permease [Secundilactobacillus folii]